MRMAGDTDVNNSVEEALLKLKLKNLAQVKRKFLQTWFESLTISPFSPFVCLSWGSAPEWAIPTIIPLFCGYRLIRINPLQALPQAIARPHIGWLFKNRGRTGLMPGGVIKIKFHSSKYSHSINHPPYPYVVMQSFYVVISEMFRPEEDLHLPIAPRVGRKILMSPTPKPYNLWWRIQLHVQLCWVTPSSKWERPCSHNGYHHLANNWGPPAGHNTFQWEHNRGSEV